MNECLEIHGPCVLNGTVRVSGAKNAALPMLLASFLTEEECIFSNVPAISDILILSSLQKSFGGESSYSEKDGIFKVCMKNLNSVSASYSLVKALRASFWLLGPLLARKREARIALPGGDKIGTRAVDMHLDAFRKMGATVNLEHGVVHATCIDGLKPEEISFYFPSVGATHQVLMAGALTEGETIINNPAQEPEVVALADMLTHMGAEIEGAGTERIVIHGKSKLSGTHEEIIGDRIEAGTYIIAGALAGEKVRVEGFKTKHLGNFLDILEDIGVNFIKDSDFVEVYKSDNLKPANIATAPFPGLATDLHPALAVLLFTINGTSSLKETVYDSRFAYVSEIVRMGGNARTTNNSHCLDGADKNNLKNVLSYDNSVSITGPCHLMGTSVEAHDVRCGAALVLAGLIAKGATRIYEPEHIKRAYVNIDKKLNDIGGSVYFLDSSYEDFNCIGC
ncbi:MAG: UDP-N-acetylglucosamine 1-carboxyvinyltransferase [Bdellovibrionota bacterium]